MSEERSPLIAIELPHSKGRLEFRTIEEIDSWASKEQTFWRWLDSAQQRNAVEYVSRVRVRLQQMNTTVINVKNDRSNPGALASQIQNLRNTLTELYVNLQLPVEASGERSFISSLNPEGNAFIAVGALMLFTQNRSDPNLVNLAIDNDLTFGSILATLYKKQIKDSAESEKQALNQLEGAFRNKLQETTTEGQRILKELSESSGSFTGQIAQQKVDFETQKNTRDADLKANLEKFQGKMKSITDSYNLDMALQKPVRYWTKKAIDHRLWAFVFGGLFIVSLVGTGTLLWDFYFETLHSNSKPEHWQLAVAAAGAFLVVWLIRVIARLFLSHVHLQTDARHREIVMQAYLALLRRPGALDEKAKQIVLETFFRPTFTGIVHDDATPPTSAEWFTRKLG